MPVALRGWIIATRILSLALASCFDKQLSLGTCPDPILGKFGHTTVFKVNETVHVGQNLSLTPVYSFENILPI